MVTLLEIMMTISPSMVACETGLSCMNCEKRLFEALYANTLDNTMCINIDGPSLDDFEANSITIV